MKKLLIALSLLVLTACNDSGGGSSGEDAGFFTAHENECTQIVENYYATVGINGGVKSLRFFDSLQACIDTDGTDAIDSLTDNGNDPSTMSNVNGVDYLVTIDSSAMVSFDTIRFYIEQGQ